jgi:hypothetical protein
VTSILALPAPLSNDPHDEPIPLLVGSYDNHLRLFTLCPRTHRRTAIRPHIEGDALGGVWRLQLMDHYIIPTTIPSSPQKQNLPASLLPAKPEPAPHELPPHETHYIILIAAMHAGASIWRITHDPIMRNGATWSMAQQATFWRGHESFVYALDAVKLWRPQQDPLVTRDFYDTRTAARVDAARARRLQRRKAAMRPLKIDVAWAAQPDGGDKRNADSDNPAARQSDDAKTAAARLPVATTISTARELEEYQRTVGSYRCLSVGFYDRALCTWMWRDGLRGEGLGVEEFLDTM